MPAIYDSNGKIRTHGNENDDMKYSPDMKLFDCMLNDELFYGVVYAEYTRREGVSFYDSDVTDAHCLFLTHKCDIKEDIKKLTNLTDIIYGWKDQMDIGCEVELCVDNKVVCDLSDISHLTKLEALRIYDCGAVDLSQISQFTDLYWLILKNTYAEDISYLKFLTGLKELSYHISSVFDLEPLHSLPKLKQLTLFVDTDISDEIILAYLPKSSKLGTIGITIKRI
jgi:hypothetical protein